MQQHVFEFYLVTTFYLFSIPYITYKGLPVALSFASSGWPFSKLRSLKTSEVLDVEDRLPVNIVAQICMVRMKGNHNYDKNTRTVIVMIIEQ